MINEDMADLIRARYPANSPEVETRIVNRRCRCGKPATERHQECAWHGATSADYARDLHDILETGRMSWRSWWRDGVKLIRREVGRR